MREVQVNIGTVEKVKNFCRKAWDIPGDLDIVGGRHIVDAKSIMGIFSLDLTKPLTVMIHNDDADISPIEEFIVGGGAK